MLNNLLNSPFPSNTNGVLETTAGQSRKSSLGPGEQSVFPVGRGSPGAYFFLLFQLIFLLLQALELEL